MIEYRPPIDTLGRTGAWHMLLEIDGCFCTHGTPLYRKQYVPFLKCLNSHENGKIFCFFTVIQYLIYYKIKISLEAHKLFSLFIILFYTNHKSFPHIWSNKVFCNFIQRQNFCLILVNIHENQIIQSVMIQRTFRTCFNNCAVTKTLLA